MTDSTAGVRSRMTRSHFTVGRVAHRTDVQQIERLWHLCTPSCVVVGSESGPNSDAEEAVLVRDS